LCSPVEGEFHIFCHYGIATAPKGRLAMTAGRRGNLISPGCHYSRLSDGVVISFLSLSLRVHASVRGNLMSDRTNHSTYYSFLLLVLFSLPLNNL
jgi:hypothetical protein